MAKSSSRGGPSRIRFIMVEADLHEGDLAQVTQVLQNAFRTSVVLPSRPQPVRLSATASDPIEMETIDDGEVEHESDQLFEASPRSRGARKSRASKVPDVLSDIDVQSDPSLKDFVGQFELKTGVDKYLVIALWFRDGRGINSITVDHVYTCFRLLNWSTTSTDFSKPLRNLRDEKSMTGGAKGYSLTLVGAGKIEDKKRGN